MKRFAVALLLSVPALIGSSSARADRRLFTSTYEYKTVPEGHTALEFWHTESRDTWDANTSQHMEHILEIEHGITDHWDAALYTILTQDAAGVGHDGAAEPGAPLSLHAMNIETRYRFADRGEWPVDVLAYGEVSKEFGESVYEIEGKAIVARDFDALLVAANVIGAVEVGHDVPETELELGWAVGASYELHPKFNLGIETFGSYEEEKGAQALIGPAFAFAPSGGLWATFTAGFGLNDNSPAMQGRLILGVEL